ncbi:hypothetical protein KVR01_011913 [Diaporthe batatas]|uniref:uncharacterized protein n=1 Tax=Diaporthe batatas TaxID=748121 RepID=UPI001D0461B0|nr:uncharacterized protein KVR01_011913 [Diaporthe batatas]KAG8158152.1 hypothetical protein KVR01_011913 [Diaporthe batatas]
MVKIPGSSERRHKDRGLFIDSLFTNRSAESADEWLKFAENEENLRRLVGFVHTESCRPGHEYVLAKMLYNPIRGSYNINWRLEYEDGFSVMIHVPIPNAVAFPDEKVRAEAAAMMLIREKTTIPVPKVYFWCTSSHNPTGYGPIIVMEYIKHTNYLEKVISDGLDTERRTGAKGAPNEKLLKAYRQMANIMLQLSSIEGSAIGFPSVPKTRTDKTLGPQSRISKVRHRPISQSTSDLILSAGLPPSVLPPINKTYNTSREYYQAMADMHLTHFTFQHNDAALSLPDGHEAYVARQLFRKLAREGRLHKDEDDDKSTDTTQKSEIFKLWCDDMRPTSVLLDDNDDVVGVVDWEMSYFAPASFSYDPPWWLIIDKPEFYRKGLSSWTKDYERHLPLFLRAMEMEEAELNKTMEGPHTSLHAGPALLAVDESNKQKPPPISMSKRMAQHWENGRFFVDYCARRNFGFDPIYWQILDKKFFGKNKTGLLLKRGRHTGRLNLLSDQERAQMTVLVKWKREHGDEEKIVEWGEKEAQALLTACLAGTLTENSIPKPRVVPWTRVDRDPPWSSLTQ